MRKKKAAQPESLGEWMARTRPSYQTTTPEIQEFMKRAQARSRLRGVEEQAQRAIKRGFKKTMVDPRLLLELIGGV